MFACSGKGQGSKDLVSSKNHHRGVLGDPFTRKAPFTLGDPNNRDYFLIFYWRSR